MTSSDVEQVLEQALFVVRKVYGSFLLSRNSTASKGGHGRPQTAKLLEQQQGC